MDSPLQSTTTTITNPIDNHIPSHINSPKSSETVSITRSDHLVHVSNSYPATFVQADTSTFKHVVQMLTGSPETAAKQDPPPPPPAPPVINKGSFVIPPIRKQSSFKLYERRQNKSSFMINALRINSSSPRFSASSNHSPRFSPRNSEVLLSPSMLDFPKLALKSPVTPLNNEDPFNKSSPLSLGNSSSSSLEEDRIIADKGFYFHRSPVSTPRDSQPQLLPLFPVTSPKLSSGSSS